MKEFKEKIEYLDKTFMYKYSDYDYVNGLLKIYFFSIDNDHKYVSLSLTKNNKNYYICEFGDLYINNTTGELFEDTSYDFIEISKTKQIFLKKFYESLQRWDGKIINIFSKLKNDSNLAI